MYAKKSDSQSGIARVKKTKWHKILIQVYNTNDTVALLENMYYVPPASSNTRHWNGGLPFVSTSRASVWNLQPWSVASYSQPVALCSLKHISAHASNVGFEKKSDGFDGGDLSSLLKQLPSFHLLPENLKLCHHIYHILFFFFRGGLRFTSKITVGSVEVLRQQVFQDFGPSPHPVSALSAQALTPHPPTPILLT